MRAILDRALVYEFREVENPRGPAQYVKVIEAGGSEFSFTFKPQDPDYPCDGAVLREYHETFEQCVIELEVRGVLWQPPQNEGKRQAERQFLRVARLGVRPVSNGKD